MTLRATVYLEQPTPEGQRYQRVYVEKTYPDQDVDRYRQFQEDVRRATEWEGWEVSFGPIGPSWRPRA